jgi:CrcB protein
MNLLYSLLAVFVGSGIGGVCRWALSVWGNGRHPLGTLAANLLGCFIIGLFSRMMPVNNPTRLLFIVGFCGGFTTFSTFIHENLLMLRGGQMITTMLYITASIVIGLLAAWVGYNLKIK